MQGGTRGGFTYAFTGAPTGDLTQGLGGSRVSLSCDPNLPRKERTFDRQFRTECVVPPGPLTDPADTLYQGNSLGDEFIAIGFANFDMVLFKHFAIAGGRDIEFRLEAYNAFNTNQFTQVDTSAVFNWATGAQTDPGFGKTTGVRANSNRVVQMAIRFRF